MTEPPARPKVWARVAQVVLLAAFLGFLVWMTASRWSEVKDVIGDLTVGALALSLLAALAAVGCTYLSWRAILADFGHRIPRLGGMKIFFVGQLTKYVPGKVWPVLAQIRLGRAYDLPGRSSAAAVVIVTLMVLGAAVLVAACLLPVLGQDAFARYWWLLLVLPIAVVVLWPRVLNGLLARALKILKREPMPQPLTARGIGTSAAWSIAALLLWGVHLWILLVDLGGSGPDLVLRATAAFAVSWAIGFLFVFAPAGAGPREVALVGLLGGSVGEPIALVVALVSRLLMTAADLIGPGIATLAERWHRRRLAAVAPAEDG